MTDMHKYKIALLRNFEVQYLKPLLARYIEDFNKKFDQAPGSNGWSKLNSLLEEIITKKTKSYEEIDKQFFEKLVFETPDHIYIRPLESDIDADEFEERYSDHTAMNRKLFSGISSNDKLITIRKYDNKIVLLYQFGTHKISEETILTLICPCVIDFNKERIIIRTKAHYVKKSRVKLGDIIDTIKDHINNKLDFEVSVGEYNPSMLHQTLFEMFKIESEKAEIVIKEHMNETNESELIHKINDFLKTDLRLHEPDKYIDRVKYAYYQDLSSSLKSSDFRNGYIFAFTFLDRQLTKSVTRNVLRDPIYNKKVYWNLKDLIYDYGELIEISLHWRFNKDDFEQIPEGDDFSFVEVSFRETNKSLEIHFYNAKAEDRRSREEYVLHRLGEYLY